MIISQKCRWCMIEVRANSHPKFNVEVANHFKQYHKERFDEIVFQLHNANEELRLLYEKYPRFSVVFGKFIVDSKKLLKEGI